MYLNPFDGARAKLERAQRLISELGDEEAIFNRANPARLVVHVLANGDHILFAEYKHKPAIAISTLVADSIGNMRSALGV
ncbi:hypothetical protein [Novosphingobium sp. 17-62-19]|uniref:hypothetical protein n=1 Tax=Novosphingobium sp. 17-62-19 TaxID=1970406 RepID=UPI0025ECA83F|nr:hypothetical protein [Novosphingobium sp. 17-62-19]HQS98056.1 hypothetical protein [Novosphingobium sp.]